MLQAVDLIFQQCVMVVRMLASELEWMTPSSWNRLKSLLVLPARVLSHQAIRNQLQVWRDGFILCAFRHVDLDESCSEIKSNHCSFQGSDFSFQPSSSLTSIGTNLGFVFLPVKYLVLQLKRFGAHPEVLSKVSSDVLGSTSLLECAWIAA